LHDDNKPYHTSHFTSEFLPRNNMAVSIHSPCLPYCPSPASRLCFRNALIIYNRISHLRLGRTGTRIFICRMPQMFSYSSIHDSTLKSGHMYIQHFMSFTEKYLFHVKCIPNLQRNAECTLRNSIY
jgi:hypothetical protein